MPKGVFDSKIYVITMKLKILKSINVYASKNLFEVSKLIVNIIGKTE